MWRRCQAERGLGRAPAWKRRGQGRAPRNQVFEKLGNEAARGPRSVSSDNKDSPSTWRRRSGREAWERQRQSGDRETCRRQRRRRCGAQPQRRAARRVWLGAMMRPSPGCDELSCPCAFLSRCESRCRLVFRSIRETKKAREDDSSRAFRSLAAWSVRLVSDSGCSATSTAGGFPGRTTTHAGRAERLHCAAVMAEPWTAVKIRMIFFCLDDPNGVVADSRDDFKIDGRPSP